jgi:hypothetical protein
MLRARPKASILTLGTLLAATPAMAGSTVSEDVVILPAEDPSPWYFAWYLTARSGAPGVRAGSGCRPLPAQAHAVGLQGCAQAPGAAHSPPRRTLWGSRGARRLRVPPTPRPGARSGGPGVRAGSGCRPLPAQAHALGLQGCAPGLRASRGGKVPLPSALVRPVPGRRSEERRSRSPPLTHPLPRVIGASGSGRSCISRTGSGTWTHPQCPIGCQGHGRRAAVPVEVPLPACGAFPNLQVKLAAATHASRLLHPDSRVHPRCWRVTPTDAGQTRQPDHRPGRR